MIVDALKRILPDPLKDGIKLYEASIHVNGYSRIGFYKADIFCIF